ncbi:MAG: DUF805 domain-containing protein [Phenylobacterium sp.]|uniref:DUF805 domain-containing protein n=1 Tax=Phenylobacterium sp. TaxID=1871053 RepID=UPI003BB511F9
MLQPLRKYTDFTGRARRSEYWLFALFVGLVQMATGILSWFVGGDLGDDAFATPASGVIALLYFGFFLYTFIPSLAVSFRRLHDSGRTAWWLLLGLIPILGHLVLLIFMILDGTPGENRYGPNPKAAAAPDVQPAI